MYLSLLRWREYNFKTVSLSGYDRSFIPKMRNFSASNQLKVWNMEIKRTIAWYIYTEIKNVYRVVNYI